MTLTLANLVHIIQDCLVMESYILKAEDLTQVSQHLIPPLLEAVLVDYSKNVEQARDAEVLNVMAIIITRLGGKYFPSLSPSPPRSYDRIHQFY